MTIRVGINGFGRIGRNVLRASLNSDFRDIEIVAINDLGDLEVMAHLFKYDSVLGKLDINVEAKGDVLHVEDKSIKFFSIRSPKDIPWKEVEVDYVIESTGLFREAEKAHGHIEGGAKRVIISAPAKGEDITIVMGVNEDWYDPDKHRIISNASCTTNCLAPLAKVLLENFGIKSGLMTTVHSYTNDQRLLDTPHKDWRRARAAAVSMIPTKTGAAQAVAKVIPELEGKFDGMAVRVPTPNVSLVDLVVEVEKETTVEEVNEAIKKATNRYLAYSDEPLVSVDYMGDPHSSIVDGLSTRVKGKQVKALSWYDNEWGYSNRLLDLILYIASKEK